MTLYHISLSAWIGNHKNTNSPQTSHISKDKSFYLMNKKFQNVCTKFICTKWFFQKTIKQKILFVVQWKQKLLRNKIKFYKKKITLQKMCVFHNSLTLQRKSLDNLYNCCKHHNYHHYHKNQHPLPLSKNIKISYCNYNSYKHHIIPLVQRVILLILQHHPTTRQLQLHQEPQLQQPAHHQSRYRFWCTKHWTLWWKVVEKL